VKHASQVELDSDKFIVTSAVSPMDRSETESVRGTGTVELS